MLDAITRGWSDWSVAPVNGDIAEESERLPSPPAAVSLAAEAPEAWPEPVDFLGVSEHVGDPVLKPEHLPAAIAGFVFDTAERLGVDPASPALACVVAATAVMSEDWRLQPRRHDSTWTERARLWGTVVGDPGVAKSPVISAATEPVEALELAAAERHKVATLAYRAEVARLKRAKSDEPSPPEPRCDRFMAESSTIEALTEVMRVDADAKYNVVPGKLLIRADELSELIANQDAYRGGKGGDGQAYLRLYDGRSHSVDRIGRGSFTLPRWAASMIGGIQPEPIQRIAQNATDDGLLQRFLYCVPHEARDGIDRAPDWDAIHRYHALFPILAALRPPTAGAVLLEDAARQHYEGLMDQRKLMLALASGSPRLRGSLNKVQGQTARLILAFHLVELADAQARGVHLPDPMIVSEETARRATSYMRDVLLPHLMRADALLYQSRQDSQARWIADYMLSNAKVRAAGRITRRDLQMNYTPFKTAGTAIERDVASVMGFLEGMGWVRAEPVRAGKGAPNAWAINPTVYTTFAARAAAERARRDEAREKVTALAKAIRARQASGTSG